MEDAAEPVGGDAASAATGTGGCDHAPVDASPRASPDYEPREVTAAGRTFAVEQTNGVADAEAAGAS